MKLGVLVISLYFVASQGFSAILGPESPCSEMEQLGHPIVKENRGRFLTSKEINADPHSFWVDLSRQAEAFTKTTGQPAYMMPMPGLVSTVDFIIKNFEEVEPTFLQTPIAPILQTLLRRAKKVKNEKVIYKDLILLTREFVAFEQERRLYPDITQWTERLSFHNRLEMGERPFAVDGWDEAFIKLFPKKVTIPLVDRLSFRTLARYEGVPVSPQDLVFKPKVLATLAGLYDHDRSHFLANQERIDWYVDQAHPQSEIQREYFRKKYSELSSFYIGEILKRSTQLPTKDERMTVDFLLFYLFREHISVDVFSLYEGSQRLLRNCQGLPIKSGLDLLFFRDYFDFAGKAPLILNYKTDGQYFLGPLSVAMPKLISGLQWLQNELKKMGYDKLQRDYNKDSI